jgi:RNA polymerase sigma-70 factor (ECF subfamily)
VAKTLANRIIAHRNDLFAFLYASVRDYHVAEDLFQDVASIILEKGPSIEPIENFSAWAKQIARFEVLNHYRKHKTRQSHLPVEQMLEVAGELFSAHSPDPEQLVEEKAALGHCLKKLPQKMSAIIHLRFAERLTHKEIAERLRQTDVSVRQAASRARRLLADCVHEKLGLTGGDA